MEEKQQRSDPSHNWKLKFCIPWITGKGNNVSDICHSCNELDQALETKSKAAMRRRTKLPELEVPPQIFFGKF